MLPGKGSMLPAWMNQAESSYIASSYMLATFPPHQQQSARSQMPQLVKRIQAKLVHNHIIIIVPLLYKGHIALYSIHLISFQDRFSVF